MQVSLTKFFCQELSGRKNYPTLGSFCASGSRSKGRNQFLSSIIIRKPLLATHYEDQPAIGSADSRGFATPCFHCGGLQLKNGIRTHRHVVLDDTRFGDPLPL